MAAVVWIARRLLDPGFWPKHMTLGDKLFRLRMIAPQDYQAIEVLVDDALRRHRRQAKRQSVR